MFQNNHFYNSEEQNTHGSELDEVIEELHHEEPFLEKSPEAAHIATLEAELASLKAKHQETHDKMMRIAADADNARKRHEKEKADARLYSIQEFAKDLLPVIDAFDKTMLSIEENQIDFSSEEGKKVGAIVEGVQLVSKVFYEAAKKHGIERLPGKDAPFNPMYHNAIAKVEDESLTQETVIDEYISGYKIGERILRTALVRVGAPK